MSNNFSKWYIALLRKQVEEELQFLKSNAHSESNQIPCMFCVNNGRGQYVCGRVRELQRFHASIVSHSGKNLRTEHERKKIGYVQPGDDGKILFDKPFYHASMPLLDIHF